MKAISLTLLYCGWAWAQSPLELAARQALNCPAGTRLVLVHEPPASEVPSSGEFRAQALSGLECAYPRVRLEKAGRSWLVVFRKEIQSARWVAASSLQAGQPLRKDDFRREQQWLANPLAEYDPPWGSRYRLRRPLTVGQPLLPGYVEAVPLYEPGCTVSVRSLQGPVRLSLQGKVLERAYVNHSLRVRLDNGAVLMVWCQSDGSLTDQPPGKEITK